MSNISHLTKKLAAFISLKDEKTHEEIAAYIVGELLGDYEGRYKGLIDDNPDVARIADLASDLEWSNGSSEQLASMWQELIELIKNLNK